MDVNEQKTIPTVVLYFLLTVKELHGTKNHHNGHRGKKEINQKNNMEIYSNGHIRAICKVLLMNIG